VREGSSLLESLQSLVENETRGVEDDGIHNSMSVCYVALSDICALLTERMREYPGDLFQGNGTQRG
jgi:hypothetical protein